MHQVKKGDHVAKTFATVCNTSGSTVVTIMRNGRQTRILKTRKAHNISNIQQNYTMIRIPSLAPFLTTTSADSSSVCSSPARLAYNLSVKRAASTTSRLWQVIAPIFVTQLIRSTRWLLKPIIGSITWQSADASFAVKTSQILALANAGL